MPRTWIASRLAGLAVCALCGCHSSSEPTAYRTYSEEQDAAVATPTSEDPSESTEGAVIVADQSTGPVAGSSEPTSSNAGVERSADARPVVAESKGTSPAAPFPTVEDEPATRPPRAPLPDPIALASATSLSGGASTATPGDAPARTAGAAPGVANPAANASTEPREVQLLIPEKSFSRVEPNGALRVSYDDIDLLKVLNMEPVPADCAKQFPSWLSGLDGQMVRIRGFMVPPIRETGLTGFIMARDNQICCFGRDPKVYDVMPVTLKEDVTTNYIPNRPFDVVGRFFIRPDVYKGQIENLYEIEDAVIIQN